MPSHLTIDDFKPVSLTCELRYKNSFFIYDRTGQVIEDVRKAFTNIEVSVSSPQQTSWVTEEGILGLGLGTCHVISTRFDKRGEAFAERCKTFFDAATHHLEIRLFTRIGLRYVLRKEYKTLDDAKVALALMALPNLKPTKRFNSSDSPIEIMFRWEDSEIGAFVRLKADTLEISGTIPPEFQDVIPNVHKKMNILTLDVDYYTVAPVDREQWNCQEWIPQKIRVIRKEVDGILYGGK